MKAVGDNLGNLFFSSIYQEENHSITGSYRLERTTVGHVLQSSAQSTVSDEVGNTAADKDWTIKQKMKACKE